MKKRDWYDREDFWSTWGSVMFSRERWEMAPEDVDKVISLTQAKPGDSVLDLCCGPGRHALELARRGFLVTGVDRTKRYLEEARRRVKMEGLYVKFIQKDMRDFRQPRAFDAAINLFTSFGFFEDQKDDRKVIQNIWASLKDGGTLVMDLIGKEIMARIFQERDWQEIDGGIMLEERKVSQDWGWVENRWILLKDGKVREFKFSLRPYSAVELTGMLADCGFSKTEVYGSLAGTPYDHQAKRLVVVAHKGKKKTK
jgi:SAM-dependent methyltransferase